jgi:ABC-2 type transport system permease protein
MRGALHAEWTKLRTLPGTGWLLLAMVALTVAASAGGVATVSCRSADCDYDLPKLSLMGIQAGQALVAVLAVLGIGGEYGTGMIRTTFTAMPRRIRVLAAKAIMLSGLTLGSGTLAVLGSVLAGRLILPGNGFTAATGHPPLSLADGPTLRAAAGSVLYLALVGLLSLGVAVAVRDSAPAVGIVFGLLYFLAVLPFMIDNPDWQRFLWQAGPMNAGLTVQSTIHLSALPIGPWEGLGVLAAWAAAALLAAGLLLRTRDA